MDGLPQHELHLWNTDRVAYYRQVMSGLGCLMFIAITKLPSPRKWGCLMTSEGWEVQWTTLAEASHACHELLRCGSEKSCRGQCRCLKAVLQFTGLLSLYRVV